MSFWDQAGGGSSPLTTKGDLYGYDSADARVPVGSDGQILTADSGEALGVKWESRSVAAGQSFVTQPGLRPPDSPATGDIEFTNHANGTAATAGPGMTWGNQGSATGNVQNGMLIMNSTTTSSLRALFIATPGTGNFEVATRSEALRWLNFQATGLVFLWGTPASPTAIEIAGWYMDAGAGTTKFNWTQYNTSYVATSDRAAVVVGRNVVGHVYHHVAWNGTTLVYTVSPNGLLNTWSPIYTATLGLGRPDYVGLGVNTNGAANPVIAEYPFLRFGWAGSDFDATTDA